MTNPWVLVGTPVGTSHGTVVETAPGVRIRSEQFLGRVAAASAHLLKVTSLLMPLNPGNTNG